jgi:undecaprenyl-diphosphatase
MMQAIVYGIIQGLTEFLPISSTAHIRIAPALLDWEDPGAAFTAVIQLGTVLAVLIYFAKDLARAFVGWARSLVGFRVETNDARMGWAVFVGTIPIVLFGLAFRHQIEGAEVRSLYVVATTLIVMGVVMWLADRFSTQTRPISSVKPKDGLIVGLWQCLALIPGMSRSGTTISGAMFAGFDRSTAARFSFLMSVPSILGAGLKEFWDHRSELTSDANLGPTIVATVVSFAVGYASIAFLIKFLQRNGLLPFVIYRIALGLVLLTLLQTGALSPQQGMAVAEHPIATGAQGR